MKKKINIFLLCLCFVLISFHSYSQGGKGINPPPPPSGPSPPFGLPIDGGVTILLALGAVYGIYEKNKKR